MEKLGTRIQYNERVKRYAKYAQKLNNFWIIWTVLQ